MPPKEHSTPAFQLRWPAIALSAIAIALLLIIFNVYYFFVRRDLSPVYYIEKIFAEEHTAIEQEPFYRAMTETYFHLNNAQGNAPVHVLIGDSITAGFSLYEFEAAGSRSVLNRGIYSDTTDGLLGRVETNVNNLKIEKFFVMIGYNDLDRKTDYDIARNIEKILDLAMAERKYVQSILPVDPRINSKKNARIAAINRSLVEICRRKGHVFIDLHSRFEENGGLNPRLTYDGVHPNYFGYQMWYSLILPYLHEG
jgi:lysophospholipase L1-like esterase